MTRLQSSGAPRRVLVVDDNHEAAELMCMATSLDGHETRVSHSALHAIALAREFLPDVAFLDIALPEIDGIELARRLRALPELAECRLVAVTGWAFPPTHTPSAPLFNAHLLKPLDIHTLQGIVLSLDHFQMTSVEVPSDIGGPEVSGPSEEARVR